MILRRGKQVACGSMQELREMFGTITYSAYFSIDDISRLGKHLNYGRRGGCSSWRPGHPRDERGDDGPPLHRGRVERIESHYPTLEEMLVKIGK